MAATSAETIDIEAQRAELRSVLASPAFARAPKLAHLLTYLCEKYFAGEANQIKEYSIGLEVFRRGSSFDQDSDSIVRVEANRLRRRLAEYYAGEGAAHPIRITIPIGQYVPRFEMQGGSVAPDSASGPIPAAGASTSSSVSAKWWAIGIGVVLACSLAIGYGVFWRHAQQKPAAETIAAPVQPEAADSQFGPPGGEEIRILAGENRSLVDHAGKMWSADVGFTGGSAVKSPVQHIARTLEPAFYRTSRQGQFRYDIPLKSGVFELRLHFAETVYGPEATGTGGEGSRLMTVKANGQTLLSHFDVIADSGASHMANVRVFTGIRAAADGKLHLEFAGEDGRPAMLSAIEILPGVNGHLRPVRLVARQSPYYSNDSHWWSPDNYFEGGQLASYTQEVTGTDDPELYETERWGNFSYAIPVTPGRYLIALHFAARHGNPGEPTQEPGNEANHIAPVFDVFCNGKALLERFDLGKEAGKTDVVIRRFTGIGPNAQGKVVLSFVPVSGYATVSAVEVLPEGRE
jgi:hypothetical protein